MLGNENDIKQATESDRLQKTKAKIRKRFHTIQSLGISRADVITSSK